MILNALSSVSGSTGGWFLSCVRRPLAWEHPFHTLAKNAPSREDGSIGFPPWMKLIETSVLRSFGCPGFPLKSRMPTNSMSHRIDAIRPSQTVSERHWYSMLSRTFSFVIVATSSLWSERPERQVRRRNGICCASQTSWSGWAKLKLGEKKVRLRGSDIANPLSGDSGPPRVYLLKDMGFCPERLRFSILFRGQPAVAK